MSNAPFNTHLARRESGTVSYRTVGHWKGPQHRNFQDVTVAKDATPFDAPLFLMLNKGKFERWNGSTGKTLAVMELPLDATQSDKERVAVCLNGQLVYEGMVEAGWEFPSSITNAKKLREALLGSPFSVGSHDREFAA